MAKVRAGLANHGEAFFAMEQLQGKGQHNKTWLSSPGENIIVSVILHPAGLLLSQQPLLNIAIAVACYDFFSIYALEETKIKWPNDIYWRDRKAGGILIENVIGKTPVNNKLPTNQVASTATNQWLWAIIGIGININQTIFSNTISNPVSLKQITGKHWNVIELTKQLCQCIQNRYKHLLSNDNLLSEYNNHLYKRNQNVKLKKANKVFTATINKVNLHGQLVVTTAFEEELNFGEVEWVL